MIITMRQLALIWSILWIVVYSPLLLAAQEFDEDMKGGSSENEDVEIDRIKETILYGIDDDVKNVLADLQQENVDTYNELLAEIITETKNTDIIRSIYRLWDDTAYTDGLVIARVELTKVFENEFFDPAIVQSAIAFIASRQDRESLSLLYALSAEHDTLTAATAIRAIGKIPGDPLVQNAVQLLERLEKEDPVAEDDLIVALIVTLGNLRYEPAADELVSILEDSSRSLGHRRPSCVSLGKIGRAEDFEIVERIFFETDDATLRSYALAGLAEFPDRNITAILVQALKRDSFWRIRVTAAEKLSDAKEESIYKLLQYKASHDPVTQVRIASLQSLGATGAQGNNAFLLDYFRNREYGTNVRLACLSVLLAEKIAGTNDAVKEVMDALWAKDEGRFLEFICRDLAKSHWEELGLLYQIMLTHKSWLIQIYGIRGIRRNEIFSLEGDITELDREGVDSRVRREIARGSED